MKLSIEEREDAVVLHCDGVLGFDPEDFRTNKDIEEAVARGIGAGKTRFVLDLTNARATYPSSIGLLFEPFRKLLPSRAARIVVVPSKLKAGRRIPLVATWGPSRLSTEDLALLQLNKVFVVLPTVDEAIQYLQSDPSIESDGE